MTLWQGYIPCLFLCHFSGRFENNCTQHHVRNDVLRDLILTTLQYTSAYVKEHEDEFIEKVRQTSILKNEADSKTLSKKIVKTEKRLTELNHFIKKLYENNVSGKLSDKRFEMLSSDYEKEYAELENFLISANAQLATAKSEAESADKFIALVHKYTDFLELTTPMIHEFIDKIVVHEADKSTGERIQEIEIYLKYVGKLDVPMPELTPEELAEEERIAKQKATLEVTTNDTTTEKGA